MDINGIIIMCKKYSVPHVITPQLQSSCVTHGEETGLSMLEAMSALPDIVLGDPGARARGGGGGVRLWFAHPAPLHLSWQTI